MFNDAFYPTPRDLAFRMWAALGDRTCILEPSAGKGDLALYDQLMGHPSYVNAKKRIDCIEIDPQLQIFLRGAGLSVVHDDFLTFVPQRYYDGIIMNPPFADGTRHLLHAWQILAAGGRIVCLLNAETLNNPCTKERVLLKDLIAMHGTVEECGQSFAHAERRTRVHVTLVCLDKPRMAQDPWLPFDLQTAIPISAENFRVAATDSTTIEHPDAIRNLVYYFNQAADAYKDFLCARERVIFFMRPLVGKDAEDLLQSKQRSNEHNYNTFLDDMSTRAWSLVFDQTQVEQYVTEGVRQELDQFRQGQARIVFSEENIRKFVQTIGMNISNIMQEALLRCFDTFTKYDKSNKIHWEGWKSNDTWRLNKRMVVPHVLNADPKWTQYGPSLSFHHNMSDQINDMDRVLCNLTGKEWGKIITVMQAIEGLCRKYTWGWEDATFFKVQIFKKGTIHLHWKDLDLLARFNQAAARGKRWLPGER